MTRKKVLKAEIGAENQYSPVLKKASKDFDKFGAGLATAVKAGAVAATAAVVGLTVAVGAMVAKTAAAGDEVQKMSLKLGVSAQTLSELKFAAEIGGASMQDVEKGMKRLAKVSSDASFGLETYKRVFRELGVEFEDGNGRLRDLDAIFNDTVGALNGLSSETRKAALVQDLFGRAGLNLLPMLKGNKEGITALRDEARRLRITFTELEANQSAEFNDAFHRSEAAVTGLFFTLSKDLIPTFTRLFDTVTEYIVNNEGLVVAIHASTAAFKEFLRILGFDINTPLEKIGQMRVELQTIQNALKQNTLVFLTELRKGEAGSAALKLRFGDAITNQMQKERELKAVISEAEQAYIKENTALKKNTTAVRTNSTVIQAAIDAEIVKLGTLAERRRARGEDALAFQQKQAAQSVAIEEARLAAIDERRSRHTPIASQDFTNLGPDNPEATAAAARIQLATDTNSEILNIFNSFANQKAAIEERYKNDSIAREKNLHAVKIQLAGQSFGAAANFMQNLTVIAGTEGGAMFETMKGLASAQALIDTYSAAQAAYKALAGIPIVGPALGVAAAAAATVAGLARVAQIQRTQPGATSGNAVGGGGTTNPGFTGGGNGAGPPPIPVTQTAPTPTQIQIQIINPLGTEDFDKIVEENIIPALTRAELRKVTI